MNHNYLFLSPHNDDETLFGAYTLLKYKPDVVVCFRSFKQRVSGITYETREEETRDALSILGIDHWTQLPFSDEDEEREEIFDALCMTLSCWPHQIDLVFAPSKEETGGNIGHNIINEIAHQVWPNRVQEYTTYTWPLGRTIGPQQVEWSVEWRELKKKAMSCYMSQINLPATAPHFDSQFSDLAEYYA